MIEVTLHEADLALVPLDDLAVLRVSDGAMVFNICLSDVNCRLLEMELHMLHPAKAA